MYEIFKDKIIRGCFKNHEIHLVLKNFRLYGIAMYSLSFKKQKLFGHLVLRKLAEKFANFAYY